MARLFGRLGDIGNSLAEIVAPLDEESEAFYEDDYEGAQGHTSQPCLESEATEEGADLPHGIDATSAGLVAALRSEIGDKADEIESMHAQIAQLKAMVRGDVGGSTQLTLEALQLVRPGVTKESAPTVIHKIIDERKQSSKHLEELKAVITDLLIAHGGPGDAPDVSSAGAAAVALEAMVQSLASQLRESRTRPNPEPTPGEQGPSVADVGAAAVASAAASELERVHSQLEAAQARGRELRQKLDASESATREALDASASAEATASSLREQVRELMDHQTEVASAAAEEKQRQLSVTAARFGELEMSMKAKEHENSQLKEVISQLRTSKNVRAEAAESATRERDDLKGKVASLAKQLEAMAAQNEELRRNIRATEARGEATEDLDAQMRHLQQVTTAQIKEMRSAHDEVVAELAATRQQLQGAQKKGDVESQRCRVAQAELEIALADHERSSSACSNLQRVLVRAFDGCAHARLRARPCAAAAVYASTH